MNVMIPGQRLGIVAKKPTRLNTPEIAMRMLAGQSMNRSKREKEIGEEISEDLQTQVSKQTQGEGRLGRSFLPEPRLLRRRWCGIIHVSPAVHQFAVALFESAALSAGCQWTAFLHRSNCCCTNQIRSVKSRVEGAMEVTSGLDRRAERGETSAETELFQLNFLTFAISREPQYQAPDTAPNFQKYLYDVWSKRWLRPDECKSRARRHLLTKHFSTRSANRPHRPRARSRSRRSAAMRR